MKEYISPEVEIRLFEAEDVLAPSRGENETDPIIYQTPFKL